MGAGTRDVQVVVGQIGGISNALLQAGLICPPAHVQTQPAFAAVIAAMLIATVKNALQFNKCPSG
jgi:hypothetical protein